ncbi:unnamed protein product, partial [Darwinula stevensoni]
MLREAMSEVASIISRHSEELKFIDLNGVLADLRREKLILHQEYHEIVQKGSKDKVLFLQDHLPWKGYIALMTFIDIVRRRGNEDLADKLQGEKLHGEQILELMAEQQQSLSESIVQLKKIKESLQNCKEARSDIQRR